MADRRTLREERKFHREVAEAVAKGNDAEAIRMLSEHDGPGLTGDDFRRMYRINKKDR